MQKVISTLIFLCSLLLLSGNTLAQDAVEVDPDHYKVEFENDKVRVLRITYGPGEESVMHSHPESVGVFLTDGIGKFTFPDGSTQDVEFTAGQVIWMAEVTHQPENPGEESFEVLQIEMKNND